MFKSSATYQFAATVCGNNLFEKVDINSLYCINSSFTQIRTQ